MPFLRDRLDRPTPGALGWVQVRADPGRDPAFPRALHLKSRQFRQLMEQHVTPVYRFALRLTRDPHVAEELTQETMLRGWKQRRRLEDEQGMKPWLFRIASNAWRDELRRRKVRSRPPRVDPEPAVRQPGAGMEASEDAQRALQAIDELPERQRDVLFLTACEGLTPTQIGEVLGITAGAAKSTLSLARAKLREQLAAEVAS